MAFSIRNIEKFIDERPDLLPQKKKLMKKARAISEDGTVIVAAAAEMIFGKELAKEFFRTLETDPIHMKIGAEDLAASNPK